MLRSRITKEDFEKLPDADKAHYKASGDKYVLDTDDAEELRTAAERARQDRDDLKRQLDAIQTQINEAKAAEQAAKDEAARKAGDVSAIEASWKAKLDAEIEKAAAETNRFKTMLTNLLVEKEAALMAADISTTPSLFKRVIADRLTAELDGEQAFTRVLDANGKPSAMTLEDLRKELVANKEFAGIIKGSKANGSGANDLPPNGGAGGDKTFDKLTEQERVTLYRSNPEEYRRQAAAAGVTLNH